MNMLLSSLSSATHRQTTVTANYTSKQLLLFVFKLHYSLMPSSTGILTAVQRQTTVTAYVSSVQLLLFVVELHVSLLPSSTGIVTAVQKQTAVNAYFSNKQLLLFFFELLDSLLPSSTGILTAEQGQTCYFFTAVTAFFTVVGHCYSAALEGESNMWNVWTLGGERGRRHTLRGIVTAANDVTDIIKTRLWLPALAQ